MYNIIIKKDLTLSTTHYMLEKENDEGKVLNKRTLEYLAIFSYVAMSIMVLFINIPTKIYVYMHKKPNWFNKKIALKGDKFRSGDNIAATINWIFRPFH